MEAVPPALRRGLVLRALELQSPQELLHRSLAQQTEAAYQAEAEPHRALARDLVWLRDSGLITQGEIRVGKTALLSYRLTPQGTLVCEGRPCDGVEFA